MRDLEVIAMRVLTVVERLCSKITSLLVLVHPAQVLVVSSLRSGLFDFSGDFILIVSGVDSFWLF